MCHRPLFVVVLISTPTVSSFHRYTAVVPPTAPRPPPCLPTPVDAYLQKNLTIRPFPFALLRLPRPTIERNGVETDSGGVATVGTSRRVRGGCFGKLQQARVPHARDPPVRQKDIAQHGQDDAVSRDVPLEDAL